MTNEECRDLVWRRMLDADLMRRYLRRYRQSRQIIVRFMTFAGIFLGGGALFQLASDNGATVLVGVTASALGAAGVALGLSSRERDAKEALDLWSDIHRDAGALWREVNSSEPTFDRDAVRRLSNAAHRADKAASPLMPRDSESLAPLMDEVVKANGL